MVVRADIVILLVAASGGYAYQLSTRLSPVEVMPVIDALPKTFPDGWRSVDQPLSGGVAEVLDADVTLQRFYQHRDGAQVFLFVAYFKEQQVNSQIHSPRQCVPGGGWSVRSLEPTVVDVPSGALDASLMQIERNNIKRQMIYWFRTRGGTVTGEYALKWDLIQNSIAQRPTDAVFVRFSADARDTNAMHDIMRRLDGPLNAILAEVGL